MILPKNLEIYKDMFNKFNIIKKINPNYILCFDKVKKSFIIINSAKNNQICLNFNSFCVNIEKQLQKTLVENSRKLFLDIDTENEKLFKQEQTNAFNLAKDKMVEAKKFLGRTNKILQSDINKITGVKDA